MAKKNKKPSTISQASKLLGFIGAGNFEGQKSVVIDQTIQTWKQSIRDKVKSDGVDYLRTLTVDGEFHKAQEQYNASPIMQQIFKAFKLTLEDVKNVMGMTLDELRKEYGIDGQAEKS